MTKNGNCIRLVSPMGYEKPWYYDAWSNLTKLTDGNGNKTNFILDDWGRITEIHTPEGGIEKYTYDYAGNISSTTDALGQQIRYQYNSFNRISQIEIKKDLSMPFIRI